MSGKTGTALGVLILCGIIGAGVAFWPRGTGETVQSEEDSAATAERQNGQAAAPESSRHSRG